MRSVVWALRGAVTRSNKKKQHGKVMRFIGGVPQDTISNQPEALAPGTPRGLENSTCPTAYGQVFTCRPFAGRTLLSALFPGRAVPGSGPGTLRRRNQARRFPASRS